MRYYGTITGLGAGGGGPPAALPALEEAGGLGWVELISLALAAAGVLAAVYLYGRGKRGRS
jgi:hypothetical protein